jgi:hypothetical protein
MFSRKNRPLLFVIVATPVILIIVGALALCVASALENLRFVKATSQILGFAGTLRSFADEQKTRLFNTGEDLWADMVQSGQILASNPHTNPWGGDIRATALDNTAMRIENDLPAQDCRRMALSFLARQPEELGLLSVEAMSDQDTVWSPIYPAPANGQQALSADIACGNTHFSRLALVFRIR